MLDQLLALRDVAAAYTTVKASLRRGDRDAVARLEAAVQREPSRLSFEPDGSRFEQTAERQVDLLADALPREVARVRHGYLTSDGIADPEGLARAVEERFESIRVGVHDDVEVLLGADFDGAVEGGRRVAQV